jgi:hypothetical protein
MGRGWPVVAGLEAKQTSWGGVGRVSCEAVALNGRDRDAIKGLSPAQDR